MNLKEIGLLEGDVELALEVYLKHCSIEVNTEDIALIGLVLASIMIIDFWKYLVIFHKDKWNIMLEWI